MTKKSVEGLEQCPSSLVTSQLKDTSLLQILFIVFVFFVFQVKIKCRISLCVCVYVYFFRFVFSRHLVFDNDFRIIM